MVNIEQRVNYLEQDMGVVKNDVGIIKDDIKEVKVECKVLGGNVGDIRLMTSTLKETNDFMRQMISKMDSMFEKMGEDQKKYEEKNDERYIEMIKTNSKQDLNCKDTELENTKEKIKNIIHIASPFITFALLGGIACYFLLVK